MSDYGLEPEIPELLSLGLAVGGRSPSNELVQEALAALMRAVKERRGTYPNLGLRINIVFHVPGPLSKPDYEGVHARRLDRKKEYLLVHAAVPETVTFSDVPQYFVEVLQQTKSEALGYLQKRKIAVDTTQVMALIDDLVSRN
jgi:hypothetical protein